MRHQYQTIANHRIRHPLVMALLLITAAPAAWAGSVCDSTAYGPGVPVSPSAAPGGEALACGAANSAIGAFSVAIGSRNQAPGSVSLAVGAWNNANGESSTAVGYSNDALDLESSAVGFDNEAGFLANAFGNGNKAQGIESSAFGTRSRAIGEASTALGYRGYAGEDFSLAAAGLYDRDGNQGLTLDVDTDGDGVNDASTEAALALGRSSVALGAGVVANGFASAALGVNARADAAFSTAIGFGSVADRDGTLSVGVAGSERQIVNVAAGTQTTDAVNLGQLQSTLATANAYTDTAVATGGTQANAYTDNREAAVREDMTAGDAQTLSQANAYTDTRMSEIGSLTDDFDAFRGEVDRRMGMQDDRIDRVGALGAAMVGMAASAAAVEGGNTRVGVAAGSYGGKQALSIGVQRRMGPRAAMTLGGAFSGSERSATVGVGIGF